MQRMQFEQGRIQFTLDLAESGQLAEYLGPHDEANVLVARCY